MKKIIVLTLLTTAIILSITPKKSLAFVPVVDLYEVWALHELKYSNIKSEGIVSVNYPCSITYVINSKTNVYWPERTKNICDKAMKMVKNKFPIENQLEQ